MLIDNHEIEDRALLVKACTVACEQSLSILYNKYKQTVFCHLYNLGAYDLAEDIYNEIFVRISQNMCKFNGEGNVRYYLCGIASNIFREEQRKLVIKTYEPKQLEIIASSLLGVSSQEYLIIREDYKRLNTEILNLPSKVRQAVELRFIYGHSISRSAIIAECTAKVFSQRVYQAKKMLRSRLKFR